MVALARALVVGTRLLLLDEPTEGIAPVLARRFVEILRDLKSVITSYSIHYTKLYETSTNGAGSASGLSRSLASGLGTRVVRSSGTARRMRCTPPAASSGAAFVSSVFRPADEAALTAACSRPSVI